ncbi:MAG: hypothetical protein ACMXYG_03360 [Candidatus Woesearchaeota archaeon]
MVDETLLKYIKGQLNKGHSAQEVTNLLVEKGYQIDAINSCFQYIYANPSNPPKHHHFGLFFVIIIIIAVIIYISFTLFMAPKEDYNLEARIDFNISEFSDQESIIFRRTIMGPSDITYNARLSYIIRDSLESVVFTESENIISSGTDERILSFNLPVRNAGLYSMITTINYEGKTITRTSSFRITETSTQAEPTCFDGIQNQGEEGIDCGGPCPPCVQQCPILYDDGNPCTISRCGPETNYQPVHDPIIPCCGNGICEESENEQTCPQDCGDSSTDSYFEITPSIEFVQNDLPLIEQIRKIRQLSMTDRERALTLCNGIVVEFYKDECFYEVADELSDDKICVLITEDRTKDKCYTKLSKNNDDSTLCSFIVSDLRRDSCYMRFALRGDFNVCVNLLDQYYVETCKQLGNLAQQVPDEIGEYSGMIE